MFILSLFTALWLFNERYLPGLKLSQIFATVYV
jgi:hypothetical protein